MGTRLYRARVSIRRALGRLAVTMNTRYMSRNDRSHCDLFGTQEMGSKFSRGDILESSVWMRGRRMDGEVDDGS